MRAVEWCAGGGGAAVGLREAGIQAVALVESDRRACLTLSEIFGRTIQPTTMCPTTPVPSAPFWWASPPCQPFSPAGRQLGESDERNLWPALLALVDAHRPRWLVAENVKGMTHKPHRPYLDWLLGELRERFASVQLLLWDAADYGVPQHRKRVFVVCGPAPIQEPRPTHSAATLLEDKANGAYWSQAFDGTDEPRPPGADGLLAHVTMREALELGRLGLVEGGGHNPSRPGDIRRLNDITDRPSTTIAAQTGGGAGNAGPFVIEERGAASGRRRLTPAECAILQDFPADHPWRGTKTSIYRQIGNAVPPRLARLLATAVLEAEAALPTQLTLWSAA